MLEMMPKHGDLLRNGLRRIPRGYRKKGQLLYDFCCRHHELEILSSAGECGDSIRLTNVPVQVDRIVDHLGICRARPTLSLLGLVRGS
jgi:hypothetical protein